MKLSDIAKGIMDARVTGEADVTGIAHDSRMVRPGDLFVAVPGTRMDGSAFVEKALKSGASAVLAAKEEHALGAPAIVAPDVRLAMGQAAGRVFGRPDLDMTVIGITGTNGKTTTSFILESILAAAGFLPGVIGTVNYRFGASTLPADTTTPESTDIFRIMGQMKEAGVTHVVMEISSHALDQRRVSGLHLRHAVFTNLSRDHLDYHSGLDDYFQAKSRLFTEVIRGDWELDRPDPDQDPVAVVNVDDEYGKRLAREVARTGTGLVGYGIDSGEADVRPARMEVTDRGIEAVFSTGKGEVPVKSALVGAHNVENLMAAVGTAISLGIAPDAIARGIEALPSVPGRLEPVPNSAGITVLVDYAHTPDALDHAVDACRRVARKRLITVFGCGGDRDPGKRPIMGKIAVEGSDIAIVTSDNPRTEEPGSIIDMILEGVESIEAVRLEAGSNGSGPHTPGRRGYLVEPDRREAINAAIKMAGPGDIVLIAGKGHEDYQVLGTEKIHFDDREEAEKAMEGRGK